MNMRNLRPAACETNGVCAEDLPNRHSSYQGAGLGQGEEVVDAIYRAADGLQNVRVEVRDDPVP